MVESIYSDYPLGPFRDALKSTAGSVAALFGTLAAGTLLGGVAAAGLEFFQIFSSAIVFLLPFVLLVNLSTVPGLLLGIAIVLLVTSFVVSERRRADKLFLLLMAHTAYTSSTMYDGPGDRWVRIAVILAALGLPYLALRLAPRLRRGGPGDAQTEERSVGSG